MIPCIVLYSILRAYQSVLEVCRPNSEHKMRSTKSCQVPQQDMLRHKFMRFPVQPARVSARVPLERVRGGKGWCTAPCSEDSRTMSLRTHLREGGGDRERRELRLEWPMDSCGWVWSCFTRMYERSNGLRNSVSCRRRIARSISSSVA